MGRGVGWGSKVTSTCLHPCEAHHPPALAMKTLLRIRLTALKC